MQATSSMRLQFADGLATVTLTEAQRDNPVDGDFARDFKRVIAELSDAPGLRAVLLCAEGSNFSFGGDLKKFYPERANLAPIVRSWTSDFHAGLARAWQLPVPIVAEVQGWAMGGAVSLIAGCDVVIAAQSAKLGSAFAQLGFSCDSGSSVTLTARMGVARARRFVLLAEVLTSEEALHTGLVDRVVADAQLAEAALAITRSLAAGPTVAYGEIKRLFLRAGRMEIEAQLEDESLTLAKVSATRDAQEGVAARIERRAAVFEGR